MKRVKSRMSLAISDLPFFKAEDFERITDLQPNIEELVISKIECDKYIGDVRISDKITHLVIESCRLSKSSVLKLCRRHKNLKSLIIRKCGLNPSFKKNSNERNLHNFK